jgi:uncharacterized protein YcfL
MRSVTFVILAAIVLASCSSNSGGTQKTEMVHNCSEHRLGDCVPDSN